MYPCQTMRLGWLLELALGFCSLLKRRCQVVPPRHRAGPREKQNLEPPSPHGRPSQRLPVDPQRQRQRQRLLRRGKAKAKPTPAPKPKAKNENTSQPTSSSVNNRKSNAYNKAKYAHKKAGYSHEEACAAGRAAGYSDVLLLCSMVVYSFF